MYNVLADDDMEVEGEADAEENTEADKSDDESSDDDSDVEDEVIMPEYLFITIRKKFILVTSYGGLSCLRRNT